MTSTPKNFAQSFEATLEMLPEILTWIQQTLNGAGLAKKEAMQFELALEEAVVNVVMHAYSQEGGKLEIQALLTQEQVVFTLIDKGALYDPISAPLKPEVPMEEMVEGGLGVKLMRVYCDGLSYERVGDHNVLVLSKKITP